MSSNAITPKLLSCLGYGEHRQGRDGFDLLHRKARRYTFDGHFKDEFLIELVVAGESVMCVVGLRQPYRHQPAILRAQ